MLKVLMRVRMQGLLDSMLNRRRGKGAGKGMKVLMAFLFAYVAVVFGGMFGMMFYAMSEPFKMLHMDWLYFSMAAMLATALCFVGSVFFAQSLIYDAKDNEMLLSLPISPGVIVLSRLSVLYLVNLAYAAMVMVPCGVVRLITGEYTALGIVGFVIFFFLLPLLPTALSSLFGGVIAAISARLRNKNLFSLVLSLVFMGAYFVVCFNLQGYLNKLVENGAAIGEAISKSMPPFYAMGLALSRGDIWQVIRFALWCIVPFFAIFTLLARSFVRIATMKRGVKKAVYREGELHVSSVRVALMKKELRHLAGSTSYMLNAGVGLIMAVGLGVAAVVKKEALMGFLKNELLASAGLDIAPLVMPLACMIVCLLMGMTLISAPSVSLEGKNLWIMQSSPVRAGDVLIGKAMAHLAVAVPAGLLASALLIWALPMTTVEAMLLLLVPVVMNVFVALLGVTINLHCPRFDYVNETVVVKQSMSVGIMMFAGMGVVALPVILYITVLRKVMSAMTVTIIFAIVLAIVSFALYDYLTRRAENAFANLNQE